MVSLTLNEILDDLRTAEEGLHKFERRYGISSNDFYDLYSRGLLDDGENMEDKSEWAASYKLKQKRQAALDQLSKQRLQKLNQEPETKGVRLIPAERTKSG